MVGGPGDSPRRLVLQAGPPASSFGGMSAVAEAIADELARSNYGYVTRLLDSGGGRGRRGYAAFPAAVAQVATSRYDLLHLHVASRGSVLRKAVLARIARRRSKPYIIHLHGGGFEHFLDDAKPSARRSVDDFFANAAGVVVLGERWAELMRERLPVAEQRLAVVPNGVTGPTELIESPQRELEILFIGGIGRSKGVDLLLDAYEAHRSDENWRGWSVVLVGPVVEPEIVRRARLLNEEEPGRVSVKGPRFAHEKTELLRRAGVFVLPSRAEGLPLVLLEAMSYGIPIVASDVGAVREILDKSGAGVVVPSGNAEDLGVALSRLLASSSSRERLGCAGRQSWEGHFTTSVMVTRLVEVWNQALR